MSPTLKHRLVLGTAMATGAILLGAGFLVYFSVKSWLLSEFDDAMTTDVRTLATMTEQNNGKIKIEPEAALLMQYTRGTRPDYFEVFSEDGSLVAKSPSLGSGSLKHPILKVEEMNWSFVTLPDGRPGRQTALTFIPALEDAGGRKPPAATAKVVTIAVARHVEEMDEKLAHLAWLLAGVGSLATVAAAFVMYGVVARGLRPLGVLAGRISGVGRENLSERIQLQDAPGELIVVVKRLNELLDRVENAMGRERAFTADVAHELRTPLAGLETTLEVCASRNRSEAEYQFTVNKCLKIIQGMHAMVDNLLMLARAEAGQLAVTRRQFSIAELIEECWARFETKAEARSIRADFEIDPDLKLETDEEKLIIVIHNLFDNAVSYCESSGWIKVIVRSESERVVLSISNSGSPLSADDAEKAFDRFWRKDISRQETGRHCGLGLSLCRKIVELLGATISIKPSNSGIFEIILVFAPMRMTESCSK